MTSNVFRSSPITDIATHDTDCHRHYRSAAQPRLHLGGAQEPGMADDVLYAPEKLVEAVDGLVAGGNTMPPRDPNDDDDDAEDEDDDAEPDEEPAVVREPDE